MDKNGLLYNELQGLSFNTGESNAASIIGVVLKLDMIMHVRLFAKNVVMLNKYN